MLKQGNLLEATEDIIVHQVNCLGLAGGLAGDLFEKYPKAEHGYKKFINKYKMAKNILGTAQLIECGDKHICNLFGQYFPGADTRYEALNMGLMRLGEYATENNLTVALPYKLGCGIGGGDWEKVQMFIQYALSGVEYKIYKLN